MTNEQFLAGSLLIDEQAIRVVRSIVAGDDFLDDRCKAVFAAALDLDNKSEIVDPLSIQKQARHYGTDLPVDYLTELMSCTPTSAYAVEYAHRVAEDSRSRRIKELAASIQMDETSSSDELLATLQRESEAIKGKTYQRSLLSPEDTLRKFTKHVVDIGNGKHSFVQTGYPRLDKILGGGLIRGGLYILGARPAMGKSTLGINLADTINGNVLYISLEMSPEQVTARRVSRLTGLPASMLLSGNVSDNDWVKIATATSALSGQGVFLNSVYGMTVSQIQLMAQSIPELNAVIIDYLGLITASTRTASTYEKVSEISRELKKMALSLNVPVVCLCQLSRSVESRSDKRPVMSDLRDSGSIEQDADAVLLLYRPDYYNRAEADESLPSLVQLDVAKNRHGRTGQTAFSFWMGHSRFEEVTQ